MRLVILFQLDVTDPDLTWHFSDQVMWTGVEVNIATVCGKSVSPRSCKSLIMRVLACLPSLKPIFNVMIYGIFSQKSQSTVPASMVDQTVGGGQTQPRKNWSSGLRQYSQSQDTSTGPTNAPKPGKDDDTRPFSVPNDNGSESWQETDTSDIEMEIIGT